MARKLRVEYAGAIYHLTVRSNGGRKLFRDDVDRHYFMGRIGEASDVHQVRVYLFCLMSTHVHLVAETPRANLGRFMQSLLTGYGVYYNRRHRSHGHVTQGRYGARLVEGSAYLLKLSRYVHLNPVMIGRMKSKPLAQRRDELRKYRWSSYPAYIELAPRNDFVNYEPVLALMEGCRGKQERARRYRRFVETGMANDDEEFALALVQSVHCIGSDDFREAIEERYRTLVTSRRANEDVAFRRITRCVSPARVVDIVATVLKLDRNDLLHRQRDCRWRAVAARMLCRYGGLTQRDAARQLGLRTGVAVSCQLKRLDQLLDSDAKLTRDVQRIEKRLEREQSKHDNTAKYQSKV